MKPVVSSGSPLSFPALVSLAAATTLVTVAVAVFVPGYLVPGGLAAVGLWLSSLLLRYLRERSAASRIGRRGRATVGVHAPSRVRALIEAYNADASPDVLGLVDYMLQQAVLQRASDVHLVPYRDFVLVRFRVDGVLADVAQLGPRLRDMVTNRLKVMAQVVTFVHDRPQDGRIGFTVAERDVDLRVAFMPTLHGERIVMRVLDRAELGLNLAGLGFAPEQLEVFSDVIHRPQGMVILNGPTGSGKTTTIYAVLRSMLAYSEHGTSIYTLEDPIEYDLLSINQTQIEEKQGFTFAQGLRTMLRQDPDVIMVGEIRDLETARIAVQAGMTGHLIISTVHAKQSSGVFVRLVELGMDPHSIASAVTAVVGQRLVRALCPECKQHASVTPGQRAKLHRPLPEVPFYVPKGCASCNQKGYAGRMGAFEILAVNEAMRELIAQRASPDRIHQLALERGMSSLMDNGLRLAASGTTSLDEVLRILPPEQRGA